MNLQITVHFQLECALDGGFHVAFIAYGGLAICSKHPKKLQKCVFLVYKVLFERVSVYLKLLQFIPVPKLGVYMCVWRVAAEREARGRERLLVLAVG